VARLYEPPRRPLGLAAPAKGGSILWQEHEPSSCPTGKAGLDFGHSGGLNFLLWCDRIQLSDSSRKGRAEARE